MLTETTAAPPISPFHEGEMRLQESVGAQDRMAEIGRKVVRNFMPDQHRTFFSKLPFVVMGAVDAGGDAWATLITGLPGFVTSPHPRRLSIRFAPDAEDPAHAGLDEGPVAVLGIEPSTQRRNRMNGLAQRNLDQLHIDVEHSYGNCPQYIQNRIPRFEGDPSKPSGVVSEHADGLDARARRLISRSDTFFVASYMDDGRGRHVDVSHRGGRPGFVRVGEDGALTVPDFAGNQFFNTLGNFLIQPRGGLLFVDFETGDVLQLSGDVEVDLTSPEVDAFQGAERLWRFTPRRTVWRAGASPLRFNFGAYAPSSLMTGSWKDADGRLRAAELRDRWRPFRVTKTIEESPTIRSFELSPIDGAGLMRHAAGQHVPVRLRIHGEDVVRTYTLSVAPSDRRYRISVKRDGRVSAHLHDVVQEGATVMLKAPAGSFTLDAAERRPAVLLAAGVGITPLLAMLRHVVYEGLRTRRTRPTVLFYGARTLAERAFDEELRDLVEAASGAVRVVRVLSRPEGFAEGEDYDHTGRIDLDLLRATLPFGAHDFYLCGPPGFAQHLYDGLRDQDVPDARIHAESFGPASLVRRRDGSAPQGPTPARKPTRVLFAQSGKEACWERGSLLELAEARGLNPPYSCRSGSCGSCRTRILEGEVAAADNATPRVLHKDREALICCSVPAESERERLVLDL